MSYERDLGLLRATGATQGLPGALGRVSLFHVELLITSLCHTPHVLLPFPFSFPLHRAPLALLSLSPSPFIPSVNCAQPWSSSVGSALLHSCKKPCPLGALQKGCPCRLLAPHLLIVQASRLHLTSHASLRPTAVHPSLPHPFLLQAFFRSPWQPRLQKPPLKAPSHASSQLLRLLSTSAWSTHKSRQQRGVGPGPRGPKYTTMRKALALLLPAQQK